MCSRRQSVARHVRLRRLFARRLTFEIYSPTVRMGLSRMLVCRPRPRQIRDIHQRSMFRHTPSNVVIHAEVIRLDIVCCHHDVAFTRLRYNGNALRYHHALLIPAVTFRRCLNSLPRCDIRVAY